MTRAAESPTIKAVVAHADSLRAWAEKKMRQDVYASPWYPTTAGAREQFRRERSRLVSEADEPPDGETEAEALDRLAELDAEAARRAILWMDRRVARYLRDEREHEEGAKRSRQRHHRRQQDAERDRDAQRRQLTAGERIDNALAELSVIGTVQAAALDADRISGSAAHDAPRFAADPAGRARHKVIECVRFAEDQLQEARRRRVENERAE